MSTIVHEIVREIVRESATAFAPATIGNIGPGFDILGLAVQGAGDTVTATVGQRKGIWITDPGHPELPTDATKHTSAIAAQEVMRLAGVTAYGIELSVQKGLPLSGGQGGSAASAAAGAVAANALLNTPLDDKQIMQACLVAESAVAGRHLDNIAPCILGGCVLVLDVETFDVPKIPTPPDLRVVLVHPHQQMLTSAGRSVVPTQIQRETFVTQSAHIAALVLALSTGDFALLRRSVRDVIAEPVRAPLLPGFIQARDAAIAAGALGCSISGSGPTAFALAQDDNDAHRIAAAMRDAYAGAGVKSDVLVSTVDTVGARVV